MFKKYTKDFLEKEVIDPSLRHEEPRLPMNRLTPFSNPLPPPEQPQTFTPPPPKQKTPSYEQPEAVLGEEIVVKGQLKFDHLLRIDGTFEGDLISEGKLIVGPKGVVRADIRLKEAYISGKVEGNIEVSNRLVLRGNAHIEGDITAQSLSVDEGVSIIGNVNVVCTSPQETPEQELSF